eukprot:926484-Amphidinium_carterae.1
MFSGTVLYDCVKLSKRCPANVSLGPNALGCLYKHVVFMTTPLKHQYANGIRMVPPIYFNKKIGEGKRCLFHAGQETGTTVGRSKAQLLS